MIQISKEYITGISISPLENGYVVEVTVTGQKFSSKRYIAGNLDEVEKIMRHFYE